MKQFFKDIYNTFIIQKNLNYLTLDYKVFSDLCHYLKVVHNKDIKLDLDINHNYIIHYKNLKIKYEWATFTLYIKEYEIKISEYRNGPWDNDVLDCIKLLKQLKKDCHKYKINKEYKAYEDAWKDYNEGKNK